MTTEEQYIELGKLLEELGSLSVDEIKTKIKAAGCLRRLKEGQICIVCPVALYLQSKLEGTLVFVCRQGISLVRDPNYRSFHGVSSTYACPPTVQEFIKAFDNKRFESEVEVEV